MTATAVATMLAAPAAMADPSGLTIGGTDDPVTYLEQAPATAIAEGLTMAGGTSYAGSYLTFAVTGAAESETLSLATDAEEVATAGTVSIVGSTVYLGNGTYADTIGSIDGSNNGQAGEPLQVNFSSPFLNPGFQTGNLNGWGAQNERIDLGNTKVKLPIAVKNGCVPTDTSTYPGMAANQDDNVPVPPGTLTIAAVTGKGAPDGSSYVAELKSTGVGVYDPYDVVHGPALASGAIYAEAGDTVSFDWRAVRGTDDYHVFGYLVDSDCKQTELIDATGMDSGWTTTTAVIPHKGAHWVVLVNGTYDSDGDREAGASLFVDNIRLGDKKVNDAVAQQIARKLMYANSSTTPPATRTVTVTAQSTNNDVGSADITVEITPVDDPPALEPIDPVTLTNTAADDVFAIVGGRLDATDPEGDAVTYGVVGGVAEEWFYAKTDFTHKKVGTYGTLHVDSDFGYYAFVPNDAAINARATDATETFTLTATAEGLTSTRELTVNIEVPGSVPGAPTSLAAKAGDGQVTLAWTAPGWLGGSAITGYRVESSPDGTAWTDVVADTDSADTSYVVTGLTNGTAVHFQVSAINTTGTGDPSDSVTATPIAAPAGGGGGPADPPATDPVETPSTDDPATPAVPVGQARVTVDGLEQPVEVSTSPDGTTTLRGDGFTIALVGVGPQGASLATDAAGRLVVVSGGAVVVSGSGFQPGSTVDVWLHSTPTLLGQVTVGLDGKFSHALPLPAGVAVGTHTVRLVGVSAAGSSLSASTGLVVLAPRAPAGPVAGGGAGAGAGSGPGSELAATGSDAPTMIALGLAFITAGALLLRVRRTADA